MAWNEPGGNGQDPWGGRKGNNEGPPDLDEAMKKFQQKINEIFGGGNGGSGNASGGGFSAAAAGLIFGAALVIYGLFGFYQVNEQERGVVLRFGLYHDTVGPGLHWNPPLVDKVIPVNVTGVRERSTTGTMLTEDLNMINVDLTVQYSIGDARDFALNVRDPESSLKQAADSALRHVVGSTEMHEALTEGRAVISAEVEQRLQQYLDEYTTGIEVQTVNVENTSPPREVQAAFDDVNKAREDEERLKNEAQAYANGIIPEARGKAQRVIEEANAYREQVIARSEGEAERFEQLLVEYSKAPGVTRDRLYLDAIQEVMQNSTKVMIDVDGGNNMMYLPLDKVMASGVTAANRNNVDDEVIREISEQVTDRVRREILSNTRRREVR